MMHNDLSGRHLEADILEHPIADRRRRCGELAKCARGRVDSANERFA